MEAQPREVERYITADGKIPFDEWFYSLQGDKSSQQKDIRKAKEYWTDYLSEENA
ncbi:MAG: hypothetical protein SAJ37_22230 [Oscillatoria sp. PMC 1068.18]|nr:hypothetical protein [Oscillatoria sp. PMC 1076.18]MEC4991462.1 hypothetical protein [Oscillatoria sp. PMC 1068.18]